MHGLYTREQQIVKKGGRVEGGMCISVPQAGVRVVRLSHCPSVQGHDNNAKVATQYFSVIRNLERALGQRGNGAWQQLRMHLMHINCLCTKREGGRGVQGTHFCGER